MKRSNRPPTAIAVALVSIAAGCAADPESLDSSELVEPVVTEDGLAEAFQVFVQTLTAAGQDQHFAIGFGPHEGLVNTRVSAGGVAANGSATIHFAEGRVDAILRGVPDDQRFDLWFVKNAAGGTAAPEAGDPSLRIGTFQPTSTPNTHQLSIAVGAGVNFDLDQIIVTVRGRAPSTSVVAAGARTLFEKRFFRERAGGRLDPVSGATLDTVETTDALIARGAQIFFNETFGGNGRTCGTCHPAENNLTIDPAFIATLQPTDPLFVAETNPDLAQLENRLLLRQDGLILENVDGFEDPTRKFVLRGVPHTLGMSTSIGRGDTFLFPPDGPPPDFRTGWSGDGAPGRGSLNEFAFGAIIQHFTRTMQRRRGVDFRVPTQAELDALEAFQLFSGRQRNPQTAVPTFREPRAEAGKSVFLGPCVACHRDLIASDINLMIDTDVELLSRSPTHDGGFGATGTDAQGGIGTGRFNVPPLVEAADTGPFFHNNSVATIEDAVAFYTTDVFTSSPGADFSGPIFLSPEQIDQVAAFLRVVNAAENIRQTRKRTVFVRDHRAPGNREILRVAIADLQDAIDDLAPVGLNPAAVHALETAKLTLETALANADADRPAFASNALVWLGLARDDLFSANPLGEF
jgi:mono/diheme cytochrome c family protein